MDSRIIQNVLFPLKLSGSYTRVILSQGCHLTELLSSVHTAILHHSTVLHSFVFLLFKSLIYTLDCELHVNKEFYCTLCVCDYELICTRRCRIVMSEVSFSYAWSCQYVLAWCQASVSVGYGWIVQKTFIDHPGCPPRQYTRINAVANLKSVLRVNYIINLASFGDFISALQVPHNARKLQ